MPCWTAKVAFIRVRNLKRKLNCHKLRSSYATSILITKLTFAMFLLSNQSFVHESRRSLARPENLQGGQQQFFIIVFFSIRYQTLISDIDTFLSGGVRHKIRPIRMRYFSVVFALDNITFGR